MGPVVWRERALALRERPPASWREQVLALRGRAPASWRERPLALRERALAFWREQVLALQERPPAFWREQVLVLRGRALAFWRERPPPAAEPTWACRSPPGHTQFHCRRKTPWPRPPSEPTAAVGKMTYTWQDPGEC